MSTTMAATTKVTTAQQLAHSLRRSLPYYDFEVDGEIVVLSDVHYRADNLPVEEASMEAYRRASDAVFPLLPDGWHIQGHYYDNDVLEVSISAY